MTLTDCIKQILTGKEIGEQSRAHMQNAKDKYFTLVSRMISDSQRELTAIDEDGKKKIARELEWLKNSAVYSVKSNRDISWRGNDGPDDLGAKISEMEDEQRTNFNSNYQDGIVGKFVYVSKYGWGDESAIFSILEFQDHTRGEDDNRETVAYLNRLVANKIKDKYNDKNKEYMFKWNPEYLRSKEGTKYLVFCTWIDNEVHDERKLNAKIFKSNKARVHTLIEATIDYHSLVQSKGYYKCREKIGCLNESLAGMIVNQGTDAASNLLDFGKLAK